MASPKLPASFATHTSIDLAEIAALAVIKNASDADGAIKAGAVLLAINTVPIDPDEENEGFRFLVGLTHGTDRTTYLRNYFG